MTTPLRGSARVAVALLALLALVGVFADLLASEAPLLARTRAGWVVLPAVTQPVRGADFERDLGEGWAVWAPVRADPTTPAPEGALAAPSARHLLGTDSHARDVLAVTIHGARTLMLSTLLVLLVALPVGVALGAWAGQGPSLVDSFLARCVELSGTLPTVVALALIHAAGVVPDFVGFIATLALLRTIEVARMVRGEVLRVGGNDFVLAARALGGSTLGVIRRHVLPHVFGPVLVSAAFTAAAIAALEATLSFLGLGLSATTPSWGGLLGESNAGIRPVALLPATAALLVTTASWYVLADALDDWASARRAGPSRV